VVAGNSTGYAEQTDGERLLQGIVRVSLGTPVANV
jgi:hypothetical protein